MQLSYTNLITCSLSLTTYLVNLCASVSATDEYTRHSAHVTQPYTGTTADNQLAPWQKSLAPRENSSTCNFHGTAPIQPKVLFIYNSKSKLELKFWQTNSDNEPRLIPFLVIYVWDEKALSRCVIQYPSSALLLWTTNIIINHQSRSITIHID